MDYETILYERKGKIVYITYNRPHVLNAVNDTMVQERDDAFREFDRDEQAWVAILSGKGKCFSAGADVKQRQLLPREELARRGGPGGLRRLGLYETVNWKPVIAAVHGYVLGGSIGTVLACDLIVASDDTKFQITEVQRGLGGALYWAQAWFWGAGKLATEIALTGRFFSAQEAHQMGMVNRVVPLAQLMTEAERLADEITANPPLSVRCNVRISRWYAHRMTEEAHMYSESLKLYFTDDFKESAHAFVEKRKPVFKGK